MCNERTLALIAKAAKKLARLDPDFAANVDRQRRARQDKSRRVAVRALTREFDRAFTRLTRSYEAETTFDARFAVESITTQDALMVSLDTVITAPRTTRTPTRLQNAQPASERRKRRGYRKEAKLHTFKGESRTLKQWSDVTGICIGTISTRLSQGWSLDDALTVKVGSVMGTQSHKHRRQTAHRHRGWSATSSDGARTSGVGSRDIETKQGFSQSTKS